MVSRQKVSPSLFFSELEEGGMGRGLRIAITVPELIFLAGKALSPNIITDIVLYPSALNDLRACFYPSVSLGNWRAR